MPQVTLPLDLLSLLKGRMRLNDIEIEGGASDVTFTGTFEGSSMKGSISALGYTFDFTGSKPSASTSAMAGGAR